MARRSISGNTQSHTTRRFARMEALEGRQMFAFGQLDSAFGTGGSATASGTTGTVTDLDILNSGQILASGNAGIVRFNANGSIDTSFGSKGKRTITGGATFCATAVDSATGNIYALVSGAVGTVVLRYTAKGAVDSKFATNGTALVTSDKAFTPSAIKVQSDGKVLVAGTVSTDSGYGAMARVYRLKGDGTTDKGFGASGSRDLTLGATDLLTPQTLDHVAAIDVDRNGNILVGGHSSAYSRSYVYYEWERSYGDSVLAVARLTSSGKLDGSFGSGGVARTTYASGRAPAGYAPLFALKRDGTTVVAKGDAKGTVVAKFDAGGAASFVTQTEGTEFGFARAMATRSDGRIILIGVNVNDAERRLQMVALDAQGAVGNVVYADDLDPSTNDLAPYGAVIAQPADGDFIIGGTPENSDGYMLMKFDAGPATATRPDDFAKGSANDIARDASGGLHVAFFDTAARVLKYAYRAPNGLWNGAVTVDAATDAGQYISIGLNSAGRAGIAYFEGTNGDLKYAQQATANGGSKFSVETVEAPGITGLYPSFDFDDSNRPSIAYYRKTGGDLKFAKKTDGVWKFETVDSANDVGRCAQLVPQPVNGRYSIAYTDTTKMQVKLASRTASGAWDREVVADATGGADYLSLAYARYDYPSGVVNRPAISYFEAGPADLKLAQNNANGDTWTITTLASKGAVGMYGAMNFDGWYGAGIYYFNRTSNSLSVLYNSFGSVRAQTIVTGGGRNLSVFSSSSRVDIAYVDEATNTLRVRSAPAAWDI